MFNRFTQKEKVTFLFPMEQQKKKEKKNCIECTVKSRAFAQVHFFYLQVIHSYTNKRAPDGDQFFFFFTKNYIEQKIQKFYANQEY